MDKRRQFLELAARCVLFSEDASTEIDKLRFLDIAQWWSNLADKAANTEAAINVNTRPLDCESAPNFDPTALRL